ncbi:polysaccharide lyase [Pontibacter sp. H249]|uniref:polysaccharide lyase n=1 Tax=Pontibacter sp. H249 TaxID=3133420 RepID=UPI0030BADB88
MCDSEAPNKALNLSRQGVFFESTFEEAKPIDKWMGQDKTSYKSIALSNDVARQGKYAVRFEINKKDPLKSGGNRAELFLPQEDELKIERWYGMSIYLPKTYVTEPEPEIVAQWHVFPDKDLGEDWRSPPVALITKNGRWILAINWAKAPVNTNETIDGFKDIDLGLYSNNTWTDWVFQIRFSWQEDGLINIWKNDTLVYTYAGPNAYNDKSGVFLKLGLYKWIWESPVPQRIVYFDEIRIGSQDADYIDVKPGSHVTGMNP